MPGVFRAWLEEDEPRAAGDSSTLIARRPAVTVAAAAAAAARLVAPRRGRATIPAVAAASFASMPRTSSLEASVTAPLIAQ